MDESENALLNEMNEFLADCAKSILLNNVKTDEIRKKIELLNEQMTNEISSIQKTNESQNNNTVNIIIECQNTISELLTATSQANKELLDEFSKKLYQINSDIESLIKSESNGFKTKIEKLEKDTHFQHAQLAKIIGNGVNDTRVMIEGVNKLVFGKSKYLPWIMFGVYLIFTILAAYIIISLRYFGILAF